MKRQVAALLLLWAVAVTSLNMESRAARGPSDRIASTLQNSLKHKVTKKDIEEVDSKALNRAKERDLAQKGLNEDMERHGEKIRELENKLKQQNEAANVRKKSLQDQGTKMDSLERKLFNLERGSIQKKPQAYKTQVYGYKKQGYSYKRKTYVYKKQAYGYKKQVYGYKKQAYFYRI